MNIAIYSDHFEQVDLQSTLQGNTPSSGSVSSMNVFMSLGDDHSVTIFHRLLAPDVVSIDGVNWVRVSSSEEFVSMVSSGNHGTFDVTIVRNHTEVFDICRQLNGLKSRVVVMLNNDLPPDDMQQLVQIGVERFAARSIESVNFYRYMPFGDRVYLTRHAVPFSFKYPEQEPIRVPGRTIWVGATREEKGFHLILRAWPLVRLQRPDAELHVFGSIHLHLPAAETGWSQVMTPEFEKSHLEALGTSLEELAGRGIFFHGATSKQAVYDFALSSCVGVVNPNVYNATETFCMSAVEIQAAGCPCVGGRAGGLLETIKDGKSGHLVHTEDPPDLANAILNCLNSGDQASIYRDSARSHAKHFLSLEQEAKAWKLVLNSETSNVAWGVRKPGALVLLVRSLNSVFLSKLVGKIDRLMARRKR